MCKRLKGVSRELIWELLSVACRMGSHLPPDTGECFNRSHASLYPGEIEGMCALSLYKQLHCESNPQPNDHKYNALIVTSPCIFFHDSE